MGRYFYACTFGDAPPRGRKSRLGESWIFACSCHHFRRRGVRQCRGGIVFVVQSAAFSSSHLSPAAWLVRRPVSGTCDYSRGCGFCWFAWYPRSPSETFRFPRSCHAQGLGNYPAVGIWLAQADGGLLHGGLISPCLIIILTSTQVLSIDDANCRVLICRCERIQTQQAQYNKFGREAGSRTGPLRGLRQCSGRIVGEQDR